MECKSCVNNSVICMHEIQRSLYNITNVSVWSHDESIFMWSSPNLIDTPPPIHFKLRYRWACLVTWPKTLLAVARPLRLAANGFHCLQTPCCSNVMTLSENKPIVCSFLCFLTRLQRHTASHFLINCWQDCPASPAQKRQHYIIIGLFHSWDVYSGTRPWINELSITITGVSFSEGKETNWWYCTKIMMMAAISSGNFASLQSAVTGAVLSLTAGVSTRVVVLQMLLSSLVWIPDMFICCGNYLSFTWE